MSDILQLSQYILPEIIADDTFRGNLVEVANLRELLKLRNMKP